MSSSADAAQTPSRQLGSRRGKTVPNKREEAQVQAQPLRSSSPPWNGHSNGNGHNGMLDRMTESVRPRNIEDLRTLEEEGLLETTGNSSARQAVKRGHARHPSRTPVEGQNGFRDESPFRSAADEKSSLKQLSKGKQKEELDGDGDAQPKGLSMRDRKAFALLVGLYLWADVGRSCVLVIDCLIRTSQLARHSYRLDIRHPALSPQTTPVLLSIGSVQPLVVALQLETIVVTRRRRLVPPAMGPAEELDCTRAGHPWLWSVVGRGTCAGLAGRGKSAPNQCAANGTETFHFGSTGRDRHPVHYRNLRDLHLLCSHAGHRSRRLGVDPALAGKPLVCIDCADDRIASRLHSQLYWVSHFEQRRLLVRFVSVPR